MEFSQEIRVLVRNNVKIENCLIVSLSYNYNTIIICCYSIKTSFYENDLTISHKPWSNKTLLTTSTETHNYTN